MYGFKTWPNSQKQQNPNINCPLVHLDSSSRVVGERIAVPSSFLLRDQTNEGTASRTPRTYWYSGMELL